MVGTERRASDSQDGTRRLAQHRFRHAPEAPVRQTPPPMSSHDDQIALLLQRAGENRMRRDSSADHGIRREPERPDYRCKFPQVGFPMRAFHRLLFDLPQPLLQQRLAHWSAGGLLSGAFRMHVFTITILL